MPPLRHPDPAHPCQRKHIARGDIASTRDVAPVRCFCVVDNPRRGTHILFETPLPRAIRGHGLPAQLSAENQVAEPADENSRRRVPSCEAEN
jgi:hypothetical protein